MPNPPAPPIPVEAAERLRKLASYSEIVTIEARDLLMLLAVYDSYEAERAAHERERAEYLDTLQVTSRDAIRFQDALKAAERELAQVREERDELEALFDLQHRRERGAIEAWRREKPGRELSLPDYGKFLLWLLDERERVEAALTAERDRAARLEAQIARLNESLEGVSNGIEQRDAALARVARLEAQLHQLEQKNDAWAEAHRPCEGDMQTLWERATTAEARVARLEEVLRELFQLVEDGVLVRDTSKDAGKFSEYALRATRLVVTLKAAQDALSSAPSAPVVEMCHHQHPLGPPGRIIMSHPMSEPCALRESVCRQPSAGSPGDRTAPRVEDKPGTTLTDAAPVVVIEREAWDRLMRKVDDAVYLLRKGETTADVPAYQTVAEGLERALAHPSVVTARGKS